MRARGSTVDTLPEKEPFSYTQCVLFPGGIRTCVAALFNSSFLADPPTFTLTGNTTGGPPITYTWTRNGAAITANSTFSISIAVNGNRTEDFQDSRYISTLTVTGRLSGEYQYSTTNRATSGMVNSEVVTITEGIIVTGGINILGGGVMEL